MQTTNTLRKIAARNAVNFVAAIASILLLGASSSALSQNIYRGGNGSAASPTFSFNSDPDTGAYRVGANSWGVAVGGANVVTVAATSITAAQRLILPLGSAASASLALTVPSGDVGLYWFNTGSMIFAGGGVNNVNWNFSSQGMKSVYQLGWSSGDPTSAPMDVRLTRYAAKQLMISGDGTGATTNAGIVAGYCASSGVGCIWASPIGGTLDTTNASIAVSTTTLTLNASASGSLTLGGNIVTPASSGTRYLCIDTSGVVSSSASACSGT